MFQVARKHDHRERARAKVFTEIKKHGPAFALLHAQNFSLDTLRRSDMVFRVAEGNALPERRKGYEQQNADGQASLNRPSTKALHRTQYLF
jgi:hypothetical protein